MLERLLFFVSVVGPLALVVGALLMLDRLFKDIDRQGSDE